MLLLLLELIADKLLLLADLVFAASLSDARREMRGERERGKEEKRTRRRNERDKQEREKAEREADESVAWTSIKCTGCCWMVD